MEKILRIVLSRWFIAVSAFLAGALVILGIRVAAYQPPNAVHYHANFAVYINGKRELFKSPTYYSEVEMACSAESDITPHERAHMHDNVYDVVHVEDSAVTWGQFFQNLNWAVNPYVIRTLDTTYIADDQHPITFILNGKEEPNIVNQVIGDKDKLLISYGTEDSTALQKQYQSIASSASHYDTAQDPASCSGHKNVTLRDRLQHMF